MEKLIIDYSMNKRRKTLYFILGSVHIILGSLALTAAFIQKLHGIIVLVLVLYTALGVVFLAGIFLKLHKYLIIDNESIIVKSNSRMHPFKVWWKDIRSVTLYPNTLRIHTTPKDIDVPLSVVGFRDVRLIKNQMEFLCTTKNIPCVRYKTIRRKQTVK